MIKAYFFDWMHTLGNATDDNKRKFLTKEEHWSLLVNPLRNAEISKRRKGKIYRVLSDVEHFLYPDSEGVIERLRPNYKLAIISNIYDISANKIKKQFPEFLNNFDVITFSYELGIRKPNPIIFKYTLYELNKICKTNISPQEVKMIGDDIDKDMGPALSLGMKVGYLNRKSNKNLEDVI